MLREAKEHNYGVPSSTVIAKAIDQLTTPVGVQVDPAIRSYSHLEDATRTLRRLNENQEGIHGTVQRKLDELRTAVENMTAQVAASRSEVPEAVRAVNESASNIVKRLTDMKSASVWERVRFGFYIPFAFTNILVVVSLARAFCELLK